METTDIIILVTYVVSFVLGIIAKKVSFVNDNIIPIQNILVGVIVMAIEWIITKDCNIAIAISGVAAGGTYDILHNLEKMRKEVK